MGISDKIEAFITELMKNNGSSIEIGRNELAQLFDCVPSQINYVLATRFGSDRGYEIESRRGGGGYIRIRHILNVPGGQLCETVSSLPDSLSESSARAVIKYLSGNNIIKEEAACAMYAAASDKSLAAASAPERDTLRAAILKNMLTAVLRLQNQS